MVTSTRGHHRSFRNSSALRIALCDFTDRSYAGCEDEYATPMSRGRRLALDGGTPVPRLAIASDHVPEEIMDFNRVQILISSPARIPASTSFCLDLGCSVSFSVAGCTTDKRASQLRPTVNSGLIFSEGPAYWQLPVP
jgi:hypothetical protein